MFSHSHSLKRLNLPVCVISGWLCMMLRFGAADVLQAYDPAITLVSKQVLLALSPLHQQLLPPPEVAHFLPSSFVPALGKAVMQQLLHAPVLSSFEHDHCRLQLWHVWWHVGLRQHRALLETQEHIRQQQQQQLVQSSPWEDTESTHCRSSSSSDLYLDADARWGPSWVLSLAGQSLRSQMKLDRAALSWHTFCHNTCAASLHFGLMWIQMVSNLLARLSVPSALVNSSDFEHVTKLAPCSRCLLLVPSPHRLFAAGYATRQLLLGLGAETEPTPASAMASSKAVATLRSVMYAGVLQRLCADRVVLSDSIAPQRSALQGALLQEVVPTAAMPAHPRYLQEAVGAPWDTLVPLLQQRWARPLCSGYRYRVQHMLHSAGQVYLQCGDPERWQRHLDGLLGMPSSEESGLDSVQGDEADDAPWGGSAASALACQDPVPVECLQHPELWWTWHQELFSLGSCDVCSRGKAGDKVRAIH